MGPSNSHQEEIGKFARGACWWRGSGRAGAGWSERGATFETLKSPRFRLNSGQKGRDRREFGCDTRSERGDRGNDDEGDQPGDETHIRWPYHYQSTQDD
jgi:hypothetical protein